MNYRTTHIYRRSLQLIDFVAAVLDRPLSGYGFLADQLRRAASVPLNYLEGCGRSGLADRRRFFQIAIGSAHEVAGALEVIEQYRLLSAADRAQGHNLCDHSTLN